MSKLTTADCQEFLAKDPAIQRLVREDRCGIAPDGTTDGDLASIYLKWAADAQVPKNWVRQAKYNVGFLTDRDRIDLLQLQTDLPGQVPDLAGGVVREFWLRDTDHITILIVEKNGQIVFHEDLSD